MKTYFIKCQNPPHHEVPEIVAHATPGNHEWPPAMAASTDQSQHQRQALNNTNQSKLITHCL